MLTDSAAGFPMNPSRTIGRLIGVFWLMKIAMATAQVVTLPTAQAALVGRFANGPLNLPVAVSLS